MKTILAVVWGILCFALGLVFNNWKVVKFDATITLGHALQVSMMAVVAYAIQFRLKASHDNRQGRKDYLLDTASSVRTVLEQVRKDIHSCPAKDDREKLPTFRQIANLLDELEFASKKFQFEKVESKIGEIKVKYYQLKSAATGGKLDVTRKQQVDGLAASIHELLSTLFCLLHEL